MIFFLGLFISALLMLYITIELLGYFRSILNACAYFVLRLRTLKWRTPLQRFLFNPAKFNDMPPMDAGNTTSATSILTGPFRHPATLQNTAKAVHIKCTVTGTVEHALARATLLLTTVRTYY
jgi:hypothetical protein